jgi:16S rRNA (guanine1516-N2)-methyltransferase
VSTICVLDQGVASQKLSECLSIPVVSPDAGEIANYIYYKNGILTIHAAADDFDFAIDFTAGKADYRRRQPQKELLLRALGDVKNVCDLTAGFAGDAFVMACAGIEVDAIEQNAIIYQLLRDAKTRLKAVLPQIADNINFYNSQAEQWQPEKHYDAIYLDPMFPERKKSAKVKKAAQVLQLLNKGLTASDWSKFNFFKSTQRVVVKRPKGAENLLTIKPNFTITGKTCRFDVYIKPNVTP